jgi:hypothetical protein
MASRSPQYGSAGTGRRLRLFEIVVIVTEAADLVREFGYGGRRP